MTELVETAVTTSDNTPYGRALKEKYFLLAPGYFNLNHGSFGTVPKPVAESQFTKFLEQEAYPDKWFRDSYYKYVDSSRVELASLIHSPVDDIVLLENASAAVNSILRSLCLKKGDKILRLSTAYGMVIETLDWMVQTLEIEVIVVPVSFPVIDATQIIEAVAAVFNDQPHEGIKLSIFSHISSLPTLIEPVKELSELCHRKGCMVMVDGAHAPGVLDIDVNDMGCDFYLGNCHKWLYAPKGTAFMWVSPSHQSPIFPEPTVISSSGKKDYVGRYAYTGTRDYTAFATIPAAIAFRDFLGGHTQIYEYNHNLVLQAGRMLASGWGTSFLVKDDNMIGYMADIILPSHNKAAVEYMADILNTEHNIYCVVGTIKSNADEAGENGLICFTRISAQVYLEIADYAPLVELVPEILSRYPGV